MIGKELIDEKAIPLSKVKEILSEQKKDNTLTYEQKTVYDYAKEFSKANSTKVEKVIEELKNEGISDRLAIKVVDIKPKTKEEIMLIFERSRTDLNEEKIKKIIELAASL